MKRSNSNRPFHVCVTSIAILALATVAAPSPAGISDCHDATCRITARDGGRGTGCVFEISQGRVFVLTAAHLVGGHPTVDCEFWWRGYRSAPLPGRVISRSEPADAAIVAVAESQFGGILPKAVPLAPRDYVVRPGDTLASVGCAGGTWSTGWKGHALGYRGADLHFTPTPADGRSGSAIFDADGRQIVGLLRARTTNNSEGIATSLQDLYRAFQVDSGQTTVDSGKRTVDSGKRTEDSREREAASGGRTEEREQSPGASDTARRSNLSSVHCPLSTLQTQCPGGVCPAPGGTYRYHLLPGPQRNQYERGRSESSGQGRGNPWPTWPGTSPAAPVVPPIDLGPTNEKLDRISELLLEMRPQQATPTEPAEPAEPAEAPEPAGPVVAPAALAAAEEAKADVAAVKQEIETSQAETGRLRAAVEALIGDRETLRQRVEDRLAKVKEELGEEASSREIAGAYVKDFAQEKLTDGTVGFSGGKLLAGALGLSAPLALGIGAGLWFLSRRIGTKLEAGEPLLVQKLFDRLGDKIDDLKDRVAKQ